ncbi:histidine kinase [Bradyrhizobium sp. NAS96.2]|uniref:sensor histidine kinase n=1 Tax=Bradyrhizobium sp. NAS96.2 TaxID=1680160 RepID=UPI00093EBFDA|nr:histidine kinase [Bradyrhizobium sp. NAS96.2]OKO67330.1 histidine kinase [Bradyrhizobium sp. NAS96.2]
MRNWSGSDLKLRLTLRVAAVATLCFAVISGYFLFDSDRSVRARIAAVADVAARTLELQQNKIQWLNNPRAEFPDLEGVAASVMAPGLCLAFRSNGGEISQRFCGGAQTDTAAPPLAFAALYRRLFDPGREAVRPVVARGHAIGEAVVWVDPAVLTAEAWHDAGRLMAVLMIALPLLCALVYAALSRALRPTRLIRDGLERIAAGDLATRLPPFDLAELSAIGDVFNQLAERLAAALSDRNALTQKLIAVQDDERRHLARELHDEFGQSLAAIRALAASARLTAAQDCPPLLAECDGIARTATDMMETLRGALFRLRPPDVDELGLAASLEGLIAGWNGRRGQPRFEIALSGSFARLPASVSANLYRIVQEALTNAAKHAGATRVVLRLQMREAASGDSEIALAVDDDGRPGDPHGDLQVKSGMGLLGMRERVAALGGRLSFEAVQPHGASLRVVVPVAAGAETAAVERAA